MRAFFQTVSLTLLLAVAADAQLKPEDLPKRQGATLLSGYPDSSFGITSAAGASLFAGNPEANADPSITPDGEVIIATSGLKHDPSAIHHLSKVVMYNVNEKVWRELTGLLTDISCVAISQDHLKVAFVQQNRATQPRELPVLHIVDTGTGVVLSRKTLGAAIIQSISWSPRADKLVFDQVEFRPMQANSPNARSVVSVLDVATGEVRAIAEGASPSWSPSGEWIAFLSRSHEIREYMGPYPANRVMLVHPDGSALHRLVEVGTSHLLFAPWFVDQRKFDFPPVWSPDSSRLLVNEEATWEKFTFDVHLLDIANGHRRRISRDKPPVYGWATGK